MRKTAVPLAVLVLALTACGSEPEGGQAAPGIRVAPSTTQPGSAPLSPVGDSVATTAARSFLRFARGSAPGTSISWAEQVAYSLDGEVVRTLDPATAARRVAWDACPRGRSTYEGRTCPVNALRAVAARDGVAAPVVVDDQAPGGVLGCSRYASPRPGPSESIAWLRPPVEQRDCFGDMAVGVTTSAAGRIVAVDLALSGP